MLSKPPLEKIAMTSPSLESAPRRDKISGTSASEGGFAQSRDVGDHLLRVESVVLG
jgi:hypothetical protein